MIFSPCDGVGPNLTPPLARNIIQQQFHIRITLTIPIIMTTIQVQRPRWAISLWWSPSVHN
jgi:hypothetical protein